MVNVLKHLCIVLGLCFICLGIPACRYVDVQGLLSGKADAVTSASVEPPDQPSGEFLVLMNRERHQRTLSEWTAFFEEREVGVIMEDLDCMVPAADVSGEELAERYRLRLAENQMKLRRTDGLLLVSRAEQGLFDIIILSREMAEAYDYSAVITQPGVETILISGQGQDSPEPEEGAGG